MQDVLCAAQEQADDACKLAQADYDGLQAAQRKAAHEAEREAERQAAAFPQCKHSDRVVHARLRRPRGREECRLYQRRAALDASRNDLCSCADPRVPSFLCRVAWCWTTAAGCECSERLNDRPGEASCSCMKNAWGEMDSHGNVWEPPGTWRPLSPWCRADEHGYCCPFERRPPSSEQPIDDAAAAVSSEELSIWCLRNGYPDPYETGASVVVRGQRYVFDHKRGRVWCL